MLYQLLHFWRSKRRQNHRRFLFLCVERREGDTSKRSHCIKRYRKRLVGFKSEEIFEILDEFKCRKSITNLNARQLICELGRQELHQKPHIVTSCWGPILQKLENDFQFKADVDAIMKNWYPPIKRL